jgi:hypothetical protein
MRFSVAAAVTALARRAGIQLSVAAADSSLFKDAFADGSRFVAVESASDLSSLLENSNVQLLQECTEQLPARFPQQRRWQSPVATCCSPALWACSHALHHACPVRRKEGSSGKKKGEINSAHHQRAYSMRVQFD